MAPRQRSRSPWRLGGRTDDLPADDRSFEITVFVSIDPALDRVKAAVRPSGNNRTFPLSEVPDDAGEDLAGHAAWVRDQIEREALDVLKS